jgi:hypothetical protein
VRLIAPSADVPRRVRGDGDFAHVGDEVHDATTTGLSSPPPTPNGFNQHQPAKQPFVNPIPQR